MARASSPTLKCPPPDSSTLSGFPRRSIGPKSQLYRVNRRPYGPWWFSSFGGRFDLPTPRGTCYLAFEPLGALLEAVGPERSNGAIATTLVNELVLWSLHIPNGRQMADCTAARAAKYGITLEISTIVPYDCPQGWARELDVAGMDGVVYFLRHDPSGVKGLGVFDVAGEADWVNEGKMPISQRLRERLDEDYGIEVLPIPSSAELRIEDDT